MNYLEDIIDSFDPVEKEEFQRFLVRNQPNRKRKDQELYSRMVNGERKPDQLIEKLHLNNSNAYHTLRKRLFKSISDYILLKSSEKNESFLLTAQSLLINARYLFSKELNEPAWTLLQRALRLSNDHEAFALTNEIILLAIEKCSTQDKLSLNQLIDVYEENNKKLRQQEKITLVQASIREQVQTAKQEGNELLLDGIFTEALTSFHMIRLSRDSPKILYELLATLRQWVIASKEFHAFEPIIDKSYESLSSKSSPYYQAQILMMLSHTKYRNKKFEESIYYLEKVNEFARQLPATARNTLQVKSDQLHAASLIFVGQLDKAIGILEGLVEMKLDQQDRTNITINLGIYYFYKKNYKLCLKYLNSLDKSDTWYKKHMGLEWTLKRDLMVILLYNDSDNKDLAEAKIRSVDRKYSAMFEQTRYKRVKSFIKIIRRIVLEEEVLNLNQLEAQVQISWEWLPKSEEDLQAMLFYGWVKSKIIKQDFYLTVRNLITQ